MADLRFSLTPLDATFGAVVEGVDLRALDEATWVALREAWLECALLIFVLVPSRKAIASRYRR